MCTVFILTYNLESGSESPLLFVIIRILLCISGLLSTYQWKYPLLLKIYDTNLIALQSLYVHLPARHPPSYPEFELPTLLQVTILFVVDIHHSSISKTLISCTNRLSRSIAKVRPLPKSSPLSAFIHLFTICGLNQNYHTGSIPRCTKKVIYCTLIYE